MDDTFHYPPEVFQLLSQTIPLLCRSKRNVLTFFQGAGVGSALMADLAERVARDREAISKYEIASTILTRLNQQGDKTLRQRREVLKRVVEYEDFSTCYPEDQQRAKGYVSDLRRVVGVKDAFTRMNLEREHERQQRQAEYTAALKSKQARQEQLRQIKEDLFKLFSLPPAESSRRGKALEGVLNRLFATYGVSVREAFELVGEQKEGVIEQVDGVIEIDGYLYLVEMKWWKEPLGKNDIAPHLVSVFNRGHAGGIYISNSGYTEPAIVQCKEALSQRTIVLCELEEIVVLLEEQGDLKELLRKKIQFASIDKKPFCKLRATADGIIQIH